MSERPTTDTAQGGGLEYIAEALRQLAVPIGSLVPDASNARTHDERNIAAIKASLERFGQRLPIVVQRQGMIVRAGNGRLVAAKQLGWSHMAAVVVDETDVEAVSFAIADNRTAELASWDDGALASLLQSLPTEARIGFDDKDLGKLLDSLRGPVEEDEAPAPLAEAVSRRGDVWTLGTHRLMCGDSTDGGDVAIVMGGEKAAMCLTDPPYGVSYVGKTEDALTIENDGSEGLENLLRASLTLAMQHTIPGAVWYVAAPPGPQFGIFANILAELEIWRQTLVWVKDSMVLGHSDYHYKHEVIFYGWTPGASHKSPPDRTRTSVLEFERPKASREHPTMKPLPLWAELLGNSSSVGDAVLEPFSGSGTTLIACEQLQRRCFAIEIEPKYVDVAIRRWQKLTGKAATLDGKTWADVAADRGVAVDNG